MRHSITLTALLLAPLAALHAQQTPTRTPSTDLPHAVAKDGKPKPSAPCMESDPATWKRVPDTVAQVRPTDKVFPNELRPCTVNIRDFGARGDGVVKDHEAIQRAVDACAARGGGTVFVPAGTYLCGTIELRSNIRLYLDAGTTIAGSSDANDYRRVLAEEWSLPKGGSLPVMNLDQYLIVARDATQVSIEGLGTVNARGHFFYDTDHPVTPAAGRRRFPAKPLLSPTPIVALISSATPKKHTSTRLVPRVPRFTTLFSPTS